MLEVTAGAGQRLSSPPANLTVGDEYKKCFSGTEVDMVLAENGLAGGWQRFDPATDEWQADSGPVGSDNKEGADPIRYRAVLPPWNTMMQPLGNNGGHSVFLAEDDGGEWKVAYLEFEEWVVGDGWVNPYELGPIPVGVTTKNLYIPGSLGAGYGTHDEPGVEPRAVMTSTPSPTT